MFARDASTVVYPESGACARVHTAPPGTNSNIRANMDTFALINTYHAKMLAYFLDRLNKTPDGEGSLLDHSMVLYGSSMSNSNQHDHDPLPIILAGGAAGQLEGGRHIKYALAHRRCRILPGGDAEHARDRGGEAGRQALVSWTFDEESV